MRPNCRGKLCRPNHLVRQTWTKELIKGQRNVRGAMWKTHCDQPHDNKHVTKMKIAQLDETIRNRYDSLKDKPRYDQTLLEQKSVIVIRIV